MMNTSDRTKVLYDIDWQLPPTVQGPLTNKKPRNRDAFKPRKLKLHIAGSYFPRRRQMR
jgi:hypothetical protein